MCLATVPFAVGYERIGIPREHWHSARRFRSPERRAAAMAEATDRVAPRNDRASRVHAPGLSGRLRVSGGAGSGAPRARRAWRTSAADARPPTSRSSCRRTTRCRSAASPRSAAPAEYPRIVSLVPSVDAPVGSARPPATGGASAAFRARTGRTKRDPLDLSARAPLRDITPSSAATAWCRARRSTT